MAFGKTLEGVSLSVEGVSVRWEERGLQENRLEDSKDKTLRSRFEETQTG